MWKVFLAEDERVVREGLRDNIPWEQHGFEFAGEAGDGELALAGIRRTKPDLLITDIRMPFMDGLTLCHMAHQENPKIKVIIISGYDDFEYARRAISEGVDRYLSKPVTRKVMESALEEERKKLDQELEQEQYLQQYRAERQEYEQFYRRVFFEDVFKGRLTFEEMYSQAGRLGLELDSPCYNLLFFSLSDGMDRAREVLSQYFLRYTQFFYFHWTIDSFGALIRGDREGVDACTKAALVEIERACSEDNPTGRWYACAGQSVERFSQLKDCYRDLSRIFSLRFLSPEEHILTGEMAEMMLDGRDSSQLEAIDVNKVNPAIVRGFLEQGSLDEAEEFAQTYISSVSEILSSRIFRDYLLLNLQFTVIAFVESIGFDRDELPGSSAAELRTLTSPEDICAYTRRLLEGAIRLKQQRESERNGGLIDRAKAYVAAHYAEESLSLNSAAGECGVSPNYFSAIFSQQMKQTFIEYVTAARMEKAKELLRTTTLRSSQIAPQIGYKDAHYFSFVFRKTQGMTPREYRQNSSPVA